MRQLAKSGKFAPPQNLSESNVGDPRLVKISGLPFVHSTFFAKQVMVGCSSASAPRGKRAPQAIQPSRPGEERQEAVGPRARLAARDPFPLPSPKHAGKKCTILKGKAES